MSSIAAASTSRAMCYTCFRPSPRCICASITRVDNATRIVVLQHPHERMHPFGTVPIARLGLTNFALEVCFNDLSARPMTDAGVALLYPSVEARDLAEMSPEKQPQTLIVLDGTWSQARALYKSNPWLAHVQHVKIKPQAPGNYRIRREPKPHCLSTVEAIVAALSILEPTTDFSPLLSAFDAMVDKQVAHMATHERVPRFRQKMHA